PHPGRWGVLMDWRPLMRLLVRGLPARLFVLPTLLRNERSVAALDAYVARRARALGVDVGPDATRLQTVPPDAALLAKAALRDDPARHLRPRRVGSLLRNTICTSGTSGSPL